MKNKETQGPQSPRPAARGKRRHGEEPAPHPPEATTPAAAPTQPAPPPPRDLTVASLSDLGRSRQIQQDFVSYYVPHDPQQMAHKGALYIVADGMGGHQAGDVASQGAVKHVISQYYAEPQADVGTALVRAFRSANRLIYDQAQANPAYAGMGTTMVAAVIMGRKVHIANTGDSRAYLIGPKAIRQITEDHSWVGEQVRIGLLTPEEARVHPQRNVVTRALGSKPNVEVDLFEGEMADHDILFMCTDGVTGHVADEEIAALARAHPPQEAAQQIVNLANERGGHDNISLLLVCGPRAVASARPTVAAPVQAKPAPAKPARQRRAPMLMGLGAAAVVLVMAALALVWHPWADGTASPSPSVEAVAQVSGTVTSTLAVSAAPGETKEAIATSAPLDVPTADTLPVATPATPGQPTSTLAAKPTEAPSPTPGPTHTPRPPSRTGTPTAPRPSPTPTSPAGRYPAPSPVEPADKAQLHGSVTFKWTWTGTLGADEAFDVRFWTQAQIDANPNHSGSGVVDTVRTTQLVLDVETVPMITGSCGSSPCYWAVVVVRQPGSKVLSEFSDKREFIYRPKDSGQGQETEPTEAPTPIRPTRTPLP